MSFDLNQLRTDADAETQGVWTDALVPKARFKIARLNNPDFQAAFAKAQKPYQDSGIEMPDSEKEEVVTNLTAEFILLDWEGIELDGKPLKYSVANAKMVLSTFKELRGKIVAFASSFANYKAKVDAEIQGN